MSIKFYCPLGHRLKVPDHRAGKKGRCPICHQKVIVPVANPRPSGKPKGEMGRARKLQEAIEAELGLAANPRSTSGPAAEQGGLTPPPSPQERALPAGTATPASSTPSPPNPPLPPASAAEPRPPSVPVPPRPIPVTPPIPQPSPAQAAAAAALGLAAAPATRPPATEPPSPRLPQRSGRWIEPANPDTLELGYRPDAARLQTVYLLGGGLAGVTAFGLTPALQRLTDLSHAPAWVQAVALLTAVQLIYAIWLVTLPDWTTVWIGMLVCAVSAAAYGAGMGIILTTPPGRTVALGLTDVRNTAGGWCTVQVLLLGFLAYGFGRTAGNWRRALAQRVASR